MDAESNQLMLCNRCERETLSRVVLTPDLPHYGKLVCDMCGCWRRWLPKPDTDPTKHRRTKQHTDLVRQFSKGYCEMCLMTAGELDDGRVLEAHHVLEYQTGGDPSRENIWILCTGCHKLVHWMRTYVGKNEPLTGLIDEVARGFKAP